MTVATATDLGGGSIGTFMPTTLAAIAQALASLELPFIDLQAKLVGALAAAASISIQPPSIDLSAALSAAIQLPGISIDVTLMAKLAADLNIEIGQLELVIALLLGLQLALGSAGVRAYLLQGRVGDFGGALGGQLASGIPGAGGPDVDGIGIVFAATDGGAIKALQTVFAVASAA